MIGSVKRRGICKTGESRKGICAAAKDFAKPRCSEPRTGFTDRVGAARNSAKSRGFGKSIPLAYEEGISRRASSRIGKTEDYAKQRSRFSEIGTGIAVFITKNWRLL
ncbi:MAG: hypothetical protein V8S32_02295 [Lachnospiraceae bacterium]